MEKSNFLILLGEDDKLDVKIMERVLKTANYTGELQHISLGPHVLDWLLKKGDYSESSHKLPDLIFLDIGLPGVDGKTILKTLRNEDSTRSIPVIIMSGSVSERDYFECITLGCNAYIQKSSDLKFFTETVGYFINGWMNLSRQEFF
jgi:CheY-like chemotaxis protein